MSCPVVRTCLSVAVVAALSTSCKRGSDGARIQALDAQEGPFECKPPTTQEGFEPVVETLPPSGSASMGHIVATVDPEAGNGSPVRDAVVVFGEPEGPCDMSKPTLPPSDPTPFPPEMSGQGQAQGQVGQGGMGDGGASVLPTPRTHQATQDLPGSTGGGQMGQMGQMMLSGDTKSRRVLLHAGMYSGTTYQRDKRLLVFNEGGALRAYVVNVGTNEKVHYVGEAKACPGTTGKGPHRIIPKQACIVQYKEKPTDPVVGTPGPGQAQVPGQGQVPGEGQVPGQGQGQVPPGGLVITPPPGMVITPQQGGMPPEGQTPTPGQVPVQPGTVPTRDPAPEYPQLPSKPGQQNQEPGKPGVPGSPRQEGNGKLISKGSGYLWYPDVPKQRPPTDPVPGKQAAPLKQPTQPPAKPTVPPAKPTEPPVKPTVPSAKPTQAPSKPPVQQKQAPSKPPVQQTQPPIFTKTGTTTQQGGTTGTGGSTFTK